MPFHFANPIFLAAALALVGALIVLAARRRPAVSPGTRVLAALGAIALALAAGGLTWRRPATEPVLVMVDLSASTRTATFRDPAALDRRARQLLGDTPFRTVYFADRIAPAAPPGSPLPDLPADATRYEPPAAPAVLLFSDARFPLPASAPPTFVVADPALDHPADAAVSRFEQRPGGPGLALGGTAAHVAATVRVGGPGRTLTIDPATADAVARVEPGEQTLVRRVADSARLATARLDPASGDRWPENDALWLPLAAPMRSERWYVSAAGAAPSDRWRLIRPGDLPTDPAAYMAPSVILLDNLPAAAFTGAQLQRLEQYVRDLGGALVIAGGDRAFAAGMYPGTALEALSPLASTPPRPAVHWMLLADSSGSMSQPVPGAPGQTRWGVASTAVLRLIPLLPPEDPVTVGAFAADLTWWSAGKSARQTAALLLPPAGAAPGGPTNLAPALERIAREAPGGVRSELLVVSDTDTVIDEPDALARRLVEKDVHLHVLAVGQGRALPALTRMTAATGGTLRGEFADPKKWADEVRALLESAWPRRLSDSPTRTTFVADLARLPARDVGPWNRTWPKADARVLATTARGGESVPLAARWAAGAGEVLALAFPPDATETEAIADLVARPPRDPRFAITWRAGPTLAVRVDATDGGKPWNGLPLRLELAPEDRSAPPAVHAIPQTAPGRYELDLPAPRGPTFATVLQGQRVLDRLPVAGRYAAEFDAVGNDYDAMRALAARTGGRLIDGAWSKAIELPRPRRPLGLAAPLALLAAALLTAALARWRWG